MFCNIFHFLQTERFLILYIAFSVSIIIQIWAVNSLLDIELFNLLYVRNSMLNIQTKMFKTYTLFDINVQNDCTCKRDMGHFRDKYILSWPY